MFSEHNNISPTPIPPPQKNDNSGGEHPPDSSFNGFAVESEGGHLEEGNVHLHALGVLAADLSPPAHEACMRQGQTENKYTRLENEIIG